MASASSDSSRITKLLKETVVLLCENSLTFSSEIHVQALLAITVDRTTIYAVQIDENLVKNGESAAGTVSSGSSGTQGRAVAAPHPPTARRLALPSPMSSPMAQPAGNDDSNLAWPLQSSSAARGMRTRGPRFPVGRGRGRGAAVRGRGAAVRGGAPAVRMIRTAVSSVRFPVGRQRMPVTQRAARPVGVRQPRAQLALPPATGGPSPLRMPAPVARQRAPAPMRQALARKSSPRLALMPPSQSSASGAAARPMQQLPAGSVRAAVLPRGVARPRLAIMPPTQQTSPQSGPVRATAAKRGVGRPRLAVMSPTQQSSPQSGSIRGAAAARGVGRPRLAIMPPVQQSSVNVQSPSQLRTVRPQSVTTVALMSPRGTAATASPAATLRTQSAATQPPSRQQSLKQEFATGLNPNLARLASQLSSSSVGSQLRAMVEQFSNQQVQPSPAKPLPPPAAAQATSVARPHVPMNVISTAVNQTQSGYAQMAAASAPSITQFQRTSQPKQDAATLRHQILSPQRSFVIPAQQRVVVTSPSGRTGAVGGGTSVTGTGILLVPSASLPSATVCQPLMFGVPNSDSSLLARGGNMTGADVYKMPNMAATSQPLTPSRERLTAANSLPYYTPFSPTHLQPASSNPAMAMPLYASPVRMAVPSPTHRPDAGTMQPPRSGLVPPDVVVPGSPFRLVHAGVENGSFGLVTTCSRTSVMQSANPLVLSPQPHLPQHYAFSPQHQPLSSFSPQHQRQASSATSHPYHLTSLLMSGAPASPQQVATASGQREIQNSPQLFSATQGQIAGGRHVPQVSQSPLQVTSLNRNQQQVVTSGQRQMPVTSVQNRMQIVQPTVSLAQSHVFAPQAMSMPVLGQTLPGYVPKSMRNQQNASVPTSTVPIQPKGSTVTQMIQPVQQVIRSTPSQTSPASLQLGGLAVPPHQPELAASNSPISQQPRPQAMSVSRAIVQAALSGTERDQQAVLDMIKQQACEKLGQFKHEAGLQQKMQAVPKTRDAQHVVATCGSAAAPSLQHPVQQPSNHLVTSPVVPRTTVSATSSRSDDSLPPVVFGMPPQSGRDQGPTKVLEQAVTVASSSAGKSQLASPDVQRKVAAVSSTQSTDTSCASFSSLADLYHASGSSKDVSVTASSSTIDGASTGSSVTNFDTSVTKARLLALQKTFELKDVVERGRQNIISEQLQQIHDDVDQVVEFDDLVEPDSPETVIVETCSDNTVARNLDTSEWAHAFAWLFCYFLVSTTHSSILLTCFTSSLEPASYITQNSSSKLLVPLSETFI